MAKRGRDADAAGPTSIVTPLPLGGTPGSLNLLDGEVVRHEEPRTQLVLNSSTAGLGRLFVTTHRLAWVPDAAAAQGFAIEYPNIVLHAVCRDSDAYDAPCIFCQLATDSGVDEDDMEGAGGSTEAQELRLVPDNALALDAIFEAMSACAELHPDAGMDDDADEADAMMGYGLGMGGPGVFKRARMGEWGGAGATYLCSERLISPHPLALLRCRLAGSAR